MKIENQLLAVVRSGADKTNTKYLTKSDRKPLQFTSRETEIMTWAAKGKTSIQISVLLKVKETTVKKHIKSACLKLSANNKTHAIAMAVSLGLIAAVRPIQSQIDET